MKIKAMIQPSFIERSYMMFKAVIFPVERYNPFHQMIIVFVSAVFSARKKINK